MASRWLLEPRRERAAGHWGEQLLCKESWPSGSIEALPWLRWLQASAQELIIVGNSVEAVETCVEAWHAGFKPVLIVVEEGLQEEARCSLAALGAQCFSKDYFSFGPHMLIAKSSDLTFRLEEDGTILELSVAGEAFKGPGIVVDVAGLEVPVDGRDPSEVWGDGDEKTSTRDGGAFDLGSLWCLLKRAEAERSLVVDPHFWEARRVPDCAPVSVPSYRAVLPWLPLGALGTFLYCVQFWRWGEPDFMLWRLLCKFPSEFFCLSSLTNVYFQAMGLNLPRCRPAACCWLAGALFFGLSYLLSVVKVDGDYPTDYATVMSAMTPGLGYLLAYVQLRPAFRWKRSNLLWFLTVAMGTYGSFILVSLIILSYLIALAWAPTFAAVYVTLAFTLFETGTVRLLQLAYVLFVQGPRSREGPNAVAGEQKWVLSFCVLMTHSFTECGRLVALICAAGRAESLEFLRSAAVTVACTVALNALTRTLWSACLLAKALGPKRASIACPTFVTVLHMESKFALGWPRFAAVLGLFLARGALWGRWQVSWLAQDQRTWCWNGVSLVTFLAVLFGEGLEDLLVYLVHLKFPAPLWRCFSARMLQRFQEQKDPYHMSHIFVPQEEQGDERASWQLGQNARMRRMPRASLFSSIMPPNCERSPNFRAALEFGLWQMLPIGLACSALVFIGFTAGMGLAGVTGHCRPMRIEVGTTLHLVRNMVLVSRDCSLEIPAPMWL